VHRALGLSKGAHGKLPGRLDEKTERRERRASFGKYKE
jgi:hypothetical protein